jgi:hypothetical protein
MQLFEDLPLPPGLWLVKWIDRFQLGHDSEAPKVGVALQKLTAQSVDEVTRLPNTAIAELLGSRPRTSEAGEIEQPIITNRVIQAGYLPILSVGEVIEGGSQVTRLPPQTREVRLTHDTALADVRVGSPLAPPPDWSASAPFRVLNRFEYQLGGIPGIQESRCLVFRFNGTEYILPKMVIFRAFYGFSSKMINALCSGPWPEKVKEVISFAPYKSGLFTGVDEDSGAWNIVLQTGVPLSHAAALALLWFDPYGRKQAESLYTDSLRQNDGRRGADGRSWHAGANIPHRLDLGPFKMRVQGFGLRPFRPSQRGSSVERFLITAITASTWTLPDQEVRVATHNSNAQGEQQYPAPEDRTYWRGKRPVEGDPDAEGTSTSDPSAQDSVNIFSATTFEYLNEPRVAPQRKKTNQVFPPSPPASADPPSMLVSAGEPTYAKVPTSPADVQERIRARSKQFEFLIQALDELVSDGQIDSFEACAPTDRALLITRNGLPCWSLLSPKDLRTGKVPSSGWEVIHRDEPSEPDRQEEARTQTRYARCALILEIHRASQSIVLIEIEPRPTESAYCIAAFEKSQHLLPWLVSLVLDAIREHEGRLRSLDLDSVFAPITSNPVAVLKHPYKHEETTQKKLGPIIGLRADLLGNALLRLLR